MNCMKKTIFNNKKYPNHKERAKSLKIDGYLTLKYYIGM